MISFITGRVIFKNEKFVVVETGGVGYKIFCPADTLFELQKPDKKENGQVSLWTHQAVREDSLDLYGFLKKEELDFFELLISISGIGPKTALGILSVSTIANLRKAIATGETSLLTKVSGIGRKIADKIVLELKDKIIASDDEKNSPSAAAESEAMDALVSLGYSERDAREVLKKTPKEITKTGDLIKFALKNLGK